MYKLVSEFVKYLLIKNSAIILKSECKIKGMNFHGKVSSIKYDFSFNYEKKENEEFLESVDQKEKLNYNFRGFYKILQLNLRIIWLSASD